MFSDTIAAISTAVGEGGIAIIRVSGPDSVREVERIFKSKNKLTQVESHTVHYGHIVDPNTGKTLKRCS